MEKIGQGSSQGTETLSEALIEMGLDMDLGEYTRELFKEELDNLQWAKEFMERYEAKRKNTKN